MKQYVTDTHALVFYLTKEKHSKLSKAAQNAFRLAADTGKARMIVPVMVLAELGWMIEKWKADLSFESILSDLARHKGV